MNLWSTAVIASVIILVSLPLTSPAKAMVTNGTQALQLPAARETRLINVGEQAPNFTVPLTDGSDFTLYDHWGAVILINLWSAS